MTEAEARAWASARWPLQSIERLEELVALVISENERHNLIAASTVDAIWSRHIVDSLQLLSFARSGSWLDVGAGAGFPGLAIASVEPDRPMTLVEPRRLRADFLGRSVTKLALKNVTVISRKIENVTQPSSVISARAVGRVGALFAAGSQCSDQKTVWILPKGKNADDELAEARQTWHGVFHVKHSITNPESSIITATDVRRRR